MEEWIKSLRRFARNKKAISGLETAIVLIAFVIVASAFAYAVLNMGFLATQKSQQVVMGGLQAASSALVIDGPVYGYSIDPGPNGNLTSIIFWLKTASEATSVDLNIGKTTIGFENPRGVWPNIYTAVDNPLYYSVGSTTYFVQNSTSGKATVATTITWEVGTGYQLVAGQKVRVTIDLTQLSLGPAGTNPNGNQDPTGTHQGDVSAAGVINKNEEFKIIVKPPIGSVFEIDRVAPAAVSTVNDLG
jgi:flagellin FlaB